MSNISQWVGIDVSQATLDVYIRPLGKALKFPNNEVGIFQLLEQAVMAFAPTGVPLTQSAINCRSICNFKEAKTLVSSLTLMVVQGIFSIKMILFCWEI